MSQIFSIVYQPVEQQYQQGEGHLDNFIRVSVETAQLIAGHGIEGDQKAGRNPRRQLNLLSTAWLAERKSEGYRSEPGNFGEQLIIDGLDVSNLKPGDVLQLGDEARIEISKARTGCIRLATAQGLDGEWTGGNIGMLATVLSSGSIRVGDPVKVMIVT